VIKWLIRSAEFTNYSYPLTPRNRRHLEAFVSTVSGCSVDEAAAYMNEILDNEDFREHIRRQISTSRRGVEMDQSIQVARRAGWYATIRATKPEVLVETGTDKGLGSCVIAEAIRRNGVGHLYTIDIEPESGFLIGERYRDLVTQIVGNSVAHLSNLKNVDWFIHDSDHSAEHESAEFAAITPTLTDRALLLSDNAHVTDVLADWSRTNNRSFLYFQEVPANHWYSGAGIGASWAPRVAN
jgi:predicted O-methyltransferase YrrM